MARDPAARERSTFPTVGGSTDDPDGSMPDDDDRDGDDSSSGGSDGGADDPFGFNDPSPAPVDDDASSGGNVGGGADTVSGVDDTNQTGQVRDITDSGTGANTPQSADDTTGPNTDEMSKPPAERESSAGGTGPSARTTQRQFSDQQQPTRGGDSGGSGDSGPSSGGGGGSTSEGSDTLIRNPNEGENAPEAENEILSTVAGEEALAQQFANRYEGVDREDVDITRTKIGGDIIARVDPDEISGPARVKLGFPAGGDPTPAERETDVSTGTKERQAVISELEDRGYDTDRLDVDVTEEGVTIDRVGEQEVSPGSRERASASGVQTVDPSRPQTAADVEAQLADRAVQQTNAKADRDTSEQFGDIAITNPATGNRVESDLQAAAAPIDRGLSVSGEVFSAGAPSATLPVFGPLLSAGQTEEQVTSGLDEAGLINRSESPIFKQEDIGDGFEGPTEQVAESTATSFGQALNPASAALEAKEVAEFGITQPPRIADAAADSTEVVAGTGLFGESLDISEQERFSGGDDFVADVQRRAAATLRASVESGERDPIGSAGSLAGGLAGGVAAGAATGRVATRVPGISGSDFSGRILAGGARRVDEFASDSRGQANLIPSGRRLITDSDAQIDDIEAISEVDDAAEQRRLQSLRETAREAGQRGRARSFEDTQYERPEVRTVSRREGRSVTGQENIRVASDRPPIDPDATFGRRSVGANADLSPRERQLAAQIETPSDDFRDVASVERRLLDDTDTASTVFDDTLAVQTAGLFGGADSAIGAAADSRSTIGTESDTLTAIDTRSDTASRGDTQVDSRADIGVDVKVGTNTRTDTDIDAVIERRVRGLEDTNVRTDTRSDTRTDPRFDPQQDIRQDFRADLDPRLDTRIDNDGRIDPDTDEPKRRRRDAGGLFDTEATAPILGADEISDKFNEIDDDIGGF